MPSTVAYVLTSVAIAATVFCLLWWLLASIGDEAPWLPAGMASGFVVLVAVGAREIMVRRAWARHMQERETRGETKTHNAAHHSSSGGGSSSSSGGAASTPSVRSSANALRALHQRLAEAEAAGAQQPEAHLEAYRLCEQYLSRTDEVMRSGKTAPDARVALRAGQERVRELQKHHLLSWARGEVKRVTQEARRRARVSDKVETAQRAVDVIDEALKLYPEESELLDSARAVRDFVASVRIAHWVELAERAAFRGRYTRAIARYRDALFYVSRANMSEDARDDAANRIYREIELLRARVATGERPVRKGTATVVRDAAEPVEAAGREPSGQAWEADATPWESPPKQSPQQSPVSQADADGTE